MEISSAGNAAQLLSPSSPRSERAEHRVNLPGGSWMLWRWVGLRGTGFPVGLLLELGAPACAEAADEMNEAERREEAARQVAISAIQQAMSEAGHHRAPSDKVLKLLEAPAYAQMLANREAVRLLVSEWKKCHAAYESARRKFNAEFSGATLLGSEKIRQVAARRDFREAVAWQNRHALRTGIDPLLRRRAGEPRNSQFRQHEQLVASYLQRYCAKNDTIGFFGPVGWARFVSGGPAIRVRSGSSLLARRNLYFESWCIDALVEHFQYHREVLPWIAPRRSCTMYEEGGVAHLPFRKPVHLSPAERALLVACDGTQPAHRIAAELVHKPGFALHSPAEVFELLDNLQARGMVWWKFELPRDLRPEVTLRKTLAQIGEERLQAPLRAALDQIEAVFAKVKAAAGDAEALSTSLGELEATFSELTGRAATRSAGKTYAGRTLVYEDCVRDAEVEIGPEVLAETGPALSLVLDSARWLSYAVWYTYRKISRNIYASLVRSAASPRIEFVRFWAQVQLYFFERREEIASAASSQFQKRWARILNPPPDQKHLQFSSVSLQAAVAKEFAIPQRPRSLTRYQSPDLMVAARDVDAFRNGDYQVVLGELHAGMNTLGWPLFIEQHPSPGDLFRAVDLDLPEPRVVPIVPKGMFGDVTRVFPALVTPKDYYLGLQPGPTQVADARYLPIGQLLVEEVGGELVLRTRDGRVQFDLLTGLGQLVEFVTASVFKIFAVDRHVPRITIDRLVICREAWSFPLAGSTFAFEKQEADRYSQTRKWVAQQGLPRFVFVRFPGEGKPVYIDFDSPIYVEILAKMVRRAAGGEQGNAGSFTVTEMLPQMEQSWLPGADGERYTCELRMVAVDPTGAS